jgi:aldehyde dehydrogenase (NAD+)
MQKLLKRYSEKITPPKILTKLFINGKYVDSVKGKTFKVYNPSTEKILAEVQEGDNLDIDLAVNAARKAFDEGIWPKMSGSERGKLLFKLADLIEKHAEELAYLESLNCGKPIKYSKYSDIYSTVGHLRYFAAWADKTHGQTIPVNGPYLCYTRHEPVGVCGQIIPWNFPLPGVASKIAPALSMGCTIVLKPAEQTPLTALRLGELINEAGFPEGVINIVPGFGQTGHSLVTHPLVDKIAFTGSTEVGLNIMKNAHEKNLKRISLELGGKSPNIIMDDADIDFAVKQANGAVFFNTGQICVAGSRTFVHEKIYDEFVEKSTFAAQNKIVGDPLDLRTELGPLIDANQRKRFESFVHKGIEEGAKLCTGGKSITGNGFFVKPTVFSEVNDNMAIAKQEIFGPIMSILKFKTIDDVIKRSNESEYGLVAGVVTKNIENAIKITNGLRTGSVYINCYGVFDANIPFGGYKNSGLGREHGEYALKNYTEVKTVVIKRPSDSLP